MFALFRCVSGPGLMSCNFNLVASCDYSFLFLETCPSVSLNKLRWCLG